MSFTVRQMEIGDYETIYGLWEKSEAIILSNADSRERIQKLLERNVGLSNVAIADDRVVGAVLCSHDGRIGYLTHLVVDKEYRRMGIGRQLVGRSVYALMGQGVSECLLLMMKETKVAVNFCRSVDPAGRVSLVMMAPR